jgi:hypothetical protein
MQLAVRGIELRGKYKIKSANEKLYICQIIKRLTSNFHVINTIYLNIKQ